MLIRTHLAVAFFFGVFFMDYFRNEFLFLGIVLISTFIPDVDSRFSKLGKLFIFRPLQFFAGHRKIFHSFILLFIVGIFVYPYSEVIFYGFTLGYGLHLFLDCFTVMGLQPFYPFKFKIKGFVKTGSLFETLLFYGFMFLNMGFVLNYFLYI